jgi:hypothetical protein
MTPWWLVLRIATLGLASLHVFPATKHIGAFVAHPSIGEAWKGFGAACAIGLYLLPARTQARMLGALWTRARTVLTLLGCVLAAAHFVPALDHLPRLLAGPSWADAWRGIGASIAILWFMLPLELQARSLALCASALRTNRRGVLAPRLL